MRREGLRLRVGVGEVGGNGILDGEEGTGFEERKRRTGGIHLRFSVASSFLRLSSLHVIASVQRTGEGER